MHLKRLHSGTAGLVHEPTSRVDGETVAADESEAERQQSHRSGSARSPNGQDERPGFLREKCRWAVRAQIRVPCIEPVTPEEAASTPRDGIESEEGLVWFSWMTAGIGYPAGFVTTVLEMYGFGYFHHPMWRR
ncbi:unnamed protein product [Linum tenue]|uniref:Uncharacterized protein n=1 Tax=Linum tenue TaxID=586396 RepID=A0AAV0R482_9ROSI|nr:unnamed protein product [Linum tenue]